MVVFEISPKPQDQQFWNHEEINHFGTGLGDDGPAPRAARRPRPGTPEPGPKIDVFRMVPKLFILLFESYFKTNFG